MIAALGLILVPRGDATEVTWARQGTSPVMTRLMGLFIGMERMIGRAFEAGLADLKAQAERSPAV